MEPFALDESGYYIPEMVGEATIITPPIARFSFEETPSPQTNLHTIEDLKQENEINVNASIRPRSGEFRTSGSGFLTHQGDWQFMSLDIFPNELLTIEVDMPVNANIRYDVLLYEIMPDGTLRLADFSVHETFINNGTVLPGMVGYANRTNQIRNFVVLVESAIGFSLTEPFVVHAAFNVMSATDPFESDQNMRNALGLYTPFSNTQNSVFTLNRRLHTSLDNDWYRISIPDTRAWEDLTITLDQTSVTAGHRVEVYRMVGTQPRLVPQDVTGRLLGLAPDTLYVRVFANDTPALRRDYTLTFRSTMPLPPPELDRLTVFNLSSTGVNFHPNAAYVNRGARPRVSQNQTLVITGIAFLNNGFTANNERLNVYLYNWGWEYVNQSFFRRSIQVTTDDRGQFTARITLGPGYGSEALQVIFSSVWHLADQGTVAIRNPRNNRVMWQQPIWIHIRSL